MPGGLVGRGTSEVEDMVLMMVSFLCAQDRKGSGRL